MRPPVCLQASGALQDGAAQKPSYSLRTLCRALDYCRTAVATYGLQRALLDGLSMAFMTQLDTDCAAGMQQLISRHILGSEWVVQVSSSSRGIQVHSFQCIYPSCAPALAQAGRNAVPSCQQVLSRKTAAKRAAPCMQSRCAPAAKTLYGHRFTSHTANPLRLQGLLRTPAEPPGGQHVLFEQFWIERGDQPLPEAGAEADGEQGLRHPAPTCAASQAAEIHLLERACLGLTACCRFAVARSRQSHAWLDDLQGRAGGL